MAARDTRPRARGRVTKLGIDRGIIQPRQSAAEVTEHDRVIAVEDAPEGAPRPQFERERRNDGSAPAVAVVSSNPLKSRTPVRGACSHHGQPASGWPRTQALAFLALSSMIFNSTASLNSSITALVRSISPRSDTDPKRKQRLVGPTSSGGTVPLHREIDLDPPGLQTDPQTGPSAARPGRSGHGRRAGPAAGHPVP